MDSCFPKATILKTDALSVLQIVSFLDFFLILSPGLFPAFSSRPQSASVILAPSFSFQIPLFFHSQFLALSNSHFIFQAREACESLTRKGKFFVNQEIQLKLKNQQLREQLKALSSSAPSTTPKLVILPEITLESSGSKQNLAVARPVVAGSSSSTASSVSESISLIRIPVSSNNPTDQPNTSGDGPNPLKRKSTDDELIPTRPPQKRQNSAQLANLEMQNRILKSQKKAKKSSPDTPSLSKLSRFLKIHVPKAE